MHALLIFGSTFTLVFALGFQSQNVNRGHYKAAFLTSFVISISNIVLYKFVPQANLIEVCAYLTAGPVAIVAAMYCHERWMN